MLASGLVVAGAATLALGALAMADTKSEDAAGGTATVLYGTAPDSLDPGFGYTTQSAESTWIAYTPLLTYAHANGTAGGKLIPGLATALPKVSADGKTYTMTLRQGLKYSDGTPVKASDFGYTIQRSIKIPWGGKAFYTSNIVGASAYDKGKASSISGITADDATGKITIKLTQPYGAFGNVLAFPSSGLVPTGTPMKNLPNDPPPGVGPYKISSVVPNQSWTLTRVPEFASYNIPGIPTGSLDTINAKIESNTLTEAQQVLANQADAFDAGDTIPPSLLGRIQSEAKDRFAKITIPSTFYFFLNTKIKPFNNKLARQAVNYAVDPKAMSRLASGFLQPSCYFIPAGIVGHPTGKCTYPGPNLAKARQLVEKSGLKGTSVTVWGQQRSPRKQYVEYYASVLNSIGFKATPKIIADATYFPTIGNAATKAQTGFADWIQDFPNPADFVFLLYGPTIQPTNNQNFGNINDPSINKAYNKLSKLPAGELSGSAKAWENVDLTQAKEAYTLVYGSEQQPKFFSNKIDFNKAIFHPTYGNDYTTWTLKS